MLSISFENGQFVGLPVQWRESLGLKRNESAREVDINDWDEIVGGRQGSTNSKLSFDIHSKNKEGFVEITCCSGGGRKTKFTVRYKGEQGGEGQLPQQIAKQLQDFSPEELEKNPDDVVNTALRMIEGQDNIHKNIIMQMEDALPTNKDFIQELEKQCVFLTDDPE